MSHLEASDTSLAYGGNLRKHHSTHLGYEWEESIFSYWKYSESFKIKHGN